MPTDDGDGESALHRLKVGVVVGINLLVAVLMALRHLDDAFDAANQPDDERKN